MPALNEGHLKRVLFVHSTKHDGCNKKAHQVSIAVGLDKRVVVQLVVNVALDSPGVGFHLKSNISSSSSKVLSVIIWTFLFGFTAYLDPVDGKPVNAVVEGGESEGPGTNLIVSTFFQVPDLYSTFSFY